MSDELLREAERHRAHDHDLEDKVERSQRLAEALTASPDPALRDVGAELAEIVGLPVGAPGVDEGAEWDRGHDRWADEQNGVG